MVKITKGQVKEYIRTKLSSDSRWAKRALLKIFEFQTAEEQDSEQTYFHNGIGFRSEEHTSELQSH